MQTRCILSGGVYLLHRLKQLPLKTGNLPEANATTHAIPACSTGGENQKATRPVARHGSTSNRYQEEMADRPETMDDYLDHRHDASQTDNIPSRWYQGEHID